MPPRRPEAGRSALDAVELTNHAAELLREHTPDFTRIHHVITAGGEAPNIVPDFAEVYLLHPPPARPTSCERSILAARQVCRGRALATETPPGDPVPGRDHGDCPQSILGRIVRSNLSRLNDLKYDEQEAAFAGRIRAALPTPLPSLEGLARVFDH